jgi:ABC-2 type transport system permease protein
MNRVLTLARAEARILIRNRLVAATGVLMPLLIGLFIGTSGKDGTWGNVVAMQLVLMLLFCVYTTATTSIAARKRQLVLKRLRSGELDDAEILAGLLAPLFVLALAQLVILVLCTVAFGAPLPPRPGLLAPALALGALMSAAIALATAAFTASAELAQITVTPFFFAAIAGATWVVSADGENALSVIAPGGALAALTRGAWEGGGMPLLACAALLAWTAAGAAVARRWFCWEPRSDG